MGCGYLLVVAELVHNSLGSHLSVFSYIKLVV